MSGHPVMVVGAGPTGLTLACTLRQSGVGCRVVDRRSGPGSEPKALVLWSGALEALHRVGISDVVRERALPLTGATYWASRRQIAKVSFGGLDGTAFPAPLCLPQPVTEKLLHDRLVELGGMVEWGVEATGVTRDDDGGVVVRLRDRRGHAESVRFPWAVAADGVHSRMRSCVAIPFEGRTYDRVFLLGDGLLEGPVPTDEASYYLTPDGVLVVVPLPGGGHRVFFDIPSGGGDTPVDGALLQRLLDARGPGGLRILETWWTSRFHVHTKVASHFRQGRVFLAGDAAHCHSPAGGQGLNTGVQDGYDLGWKLAAAIRGAGPALLDSYEAERRPASVRAVRNADRQTRLWLLRSRAAKAVRDTVMSRLSRSGVLERKLVPQLAQLDLDHSRSPAVADLAGAGAAPAPARRGRRMPDLPLSPVHGTTATSLHDYLSAGRHTILVGGCATGTIAAHAQATLTARGVTDVANVLWVRPGAAPGAAGWATGYAVAEENGHSLATGQQWLVYIRPDGVVGARAGGAALEPLLDRVPSLSASRIGG